MCVRVEVLYVLDKVKAFNALDNRRGDVTSGYFSPAGKHSSRMNHEYLLRLKVIVPYVNDVAMEIVLYIGSTLSGRDSGNLEYT